MHEIAATVSPTVIILFGILYNQRGTDKLEGRMDRMEKHFESRIDRLETHMNARFDRMQDDLAGFHRSLGQHDKAIEVLEKRAS